MSSLCLCLSDNIAWCYIMLDNDVHGLQAVLKMLSEIGSVENIPEFLEGVKNRCLFSDNYYCKVQDYLIHF